MGIGIVLHYLHNTDSDIRPVQDPVLLVPPKPLNRQSAPLTEPLPDKENIQLQATLIAASSLDDRRLQGRIGVMRIDPEDLAEYEQGLIENLTGAGAKDPAELANLSEWIEAPITHIAAKKYRLGPVVVPAADSYSVVAWADDFRFFIQAYEVTTSDIYRIHDVGDLAENQPTGLRINLTGADDEQSIYQLRINRSANEPRRKANQLFGLLLPLMAPDIASAYADSLPIKVHSGSVVLPLIPEERLRITPITTTDLQGASVEVNLQSEQIIDVDVDVSTLDTNSIDLQGQLVSSKNQAPLSEVSLSRIGTQQQHISITDDHGFFYFKNLPRNTPSVFRILQNTDDLVEISLIPTSGDIIFAPSQLAIMPDQTSILKQWELTTYQWLILSLSDNDRAMLALKSSRGYPIYQLQQFDQGKWIDVGSDNFLPHPSGIAISIKTPGTYRVLATVSSVFEFSSSTVEITKENNQFHSHLMTDINSSEYTIILTDAFTRQPVTDASISILGAHRSLLPMSAKPDENGEVFLPEVNASSLVLNIRTATGETELILDKLQPIIPVELTYSPSFSARIKRD